jgi:glycosyltransferase involved in cell wall biosynthesis
MLPFFLFRFDRAVRRAVLHVRPDVIHAHWWFPGGWLATRGTPPAVVTTHGSDVRLAERFWALRRVARRVVGRAAAVTAASEFLARQVERLAGGATSVQVTRMPVDEVPLARVRDRRRVHPPRILFAGNLVASKGVDVLIRALAVLKRRGVECRLRLVGSGPQAGRLDALARQLGVADWIERSPLVTRDAMPGEYGAATVTVLPSRRDAEGLGLVLVESLIAGTPVVGTRTGGIPEVVRHEETGLLAREGDADDLALQLQRMLESYALRQSTVARGQTLVRARHDPRVLSEQLLRLYHDVLERHP